SDPDDDPLQFFWYADGQTRALALGAVATNQFAIGPHTVALALSDGYDTSTARVTFEVITPAAAVGQLTSLVDGATFGSQNDRPLLAALSAASSSFDRGNMTAAFNQLSAFENKVRAQVASSDPELAARLTAAAEAIIGVLR